MGERFVLAGYSFGAWVCARAVSDIGGDIGLCLVAYPFSVYRSDELRAFRGKICFIGGSLDEISPLDALLALYRELPADKSLKVVPSGHTFDGEEPEITAFVRETFEKEAGVAPHASQRDHGSRRKAHHGGGQGRRGEDHLRLRHRPRSCAKAGRKVLLISSDPTPSLSDIYEQEIGSTEKRIVDGPRALRS